MKKIKILLLVFSLLFMGCAGRSVKVLDAPWVSMKHQQLPKDLSAVKEIGTIEEKYCHNSFKGSGSVGLIDEVIKQAEQKHQIDYIRNASVTHEVGRSCVEISGTGYRKTSTL